MLMITNNSKSRCPLWHAKPLYKWLLCIASNTNDEKTGNVQSLVFWITQICKIDFLFFFLSMNLVDFATDVALILLQVYKAVIKRTSYQPCNSGCGISTTCGSW